MVYNKTVVDWLLGQRQLCLTLERTCCPKPQSSGQTKLLLSSNPVNNCIMFDQSIDQNIFPSMLGTAPRGKYSGLLTSQTLNNCIISIMNVRNNYTYPFSIKYSGNLIVNYSIQKLYDVPNVKRPYLYLYVSNPKSKCYKIKYTRITPDRGKKTRKFTDRRTTGDQKSSLEL